MTGRANSRFASQNVDQTHRRATQSFGVLLLVLGTLLVVLPLSTTALHVGKIVALSILLAINARWGDSRVWYAFVLFLVLMVVSLVPVLRIWNPMVVPATGFALVAYARPHWFEGNRWLVRGRASRATWVLASLTIPLCAVALVVWTFMAQPDLTLYADMVPGTGIGLALGAAFVFALFTAIGEEVVFRGVIWQALSDTGLTIGPVLIIQALAFGILHFGGVPSGLVGVGLASGYGLALGGIRFLSKGLLMPVIVHIFADLTIFMIMMRLAER